MLSSTRLKLFALLAVFVLPLLMSELLYHYYDFFHMSKVNHGVLITPPVHDAQLAQPHAWQIVYLPEDCTTANADQIMFTLHQLRLVLGKDSDRVKLTLVVKNNCQRSDTHDFRKLALSNDQVSRLQASLKATALEDKIYLVDPLGNVFMYYLSSAPAMSILKDLQRVLEVSQIG